MYKLFFLSICCFFLLIACDPANSNSSAIQEQAPKESNTANDKYYAPIKKTDELVLHFTGSISDFDDITSLNAPRSTSANSYSFFKTIAPAFMSPTYCGCMQLATIKGLKYPNDWDMSKYEDGYLCDADGDGDQDFLVPIVCQKSEEVPITIAFINESKDPDFFRIASNNFMEFPNGKGLPDCKE